MAAALLTALEHFDDLKALSGTDPDKARGRALYIVKWGIERFVKERVDPGSPADEVELLRSSLEALAEREARTKADDIRGWIHEALSAEDSAVELMSPDDEGGERPPTFPTGLSSLDGLTGGGYGFTVVAGAPKVGKSLLAMSTAVESAAAGWRVIYVNAELNRYEMVARLRHYMHPLPKAVVENLHIINAGTGITPEHVAAIADEVVRPGDELLLVVLDSINRLTNRSGVGNSPDGYWSALERWSEWPRQMARISNGACSSLVVSELNAQGAIKGRNLEYSASLAVSIRATESTGIVEIDVPYARASAGGQLGSHTRVWDQGRFVPEYESLTRSVVRVEEPLW